MIIKNDCSCVAEVKVVYRKKTAHRHKCSVCGKLIADGSRVVMEKYVSEKFYPVKGIMKFVKWVFKHEACVSGKEASG